ncbi:Uncharacterised protein [Sphingobacterium multivorum]|uniref:hypothetical protein n=1 Tax=Sphingobacterium multivorum TaxID=28454 RepID=UPI000E089F01|nr:hypothetical protein [Sphingobacterium multivorum]QQT44885.1 hypothetical protein I6J00_24850 [Sphingobacterium multivorum]SUJ18263.1 Uncharacterised protein [Sphingobacterium multivorum]
MALYFTVKSSRQAAISNIYAIAAIQSIENETDGGEHFSIITLNSGKQLNIVEPVNQVIELIQNTGNEGVVELIEFISEGFERPEFGWEPHEA